MIDDISFNYIDELGNLKKYLIIDRFSFNDKNYMIYKEYDRDDLYASYYEIINDKLKIIPIETASEYDIVDKYLEGM